MADSKVCTHESFISDVTAHRQIMGEVIKPPRLYLDNADAGSRAVISAADASHDDFQFLGVGTIKRQNEIGKLIVATVNAYPAVLKLMRALEFYADPSAWKKKNDPENLVAIPDFYCELDFGMEAKDAIARFRELSNGCKP